MSHIRSSQPILLKCNWCGKKTVLTLPTEGIAKYNAGAFVQDAFPELSPAEREMIISNTCEGCWNKMFVVE